MLNKKEIYHELMRISYEILDEIVSPVCGIPKGTIVADIWLADLECYIMDDSQEREKIYEEIKKKYQISDDEMDAYVDSYTPLIQIALFIYLRSGKETPDGTTA